MTSPELTVRPLTSETWEDFETVMSARGGARGCWCMHWRSSIAEWMENKGEGNRAAMRALAERDTPPGVVGYLDAEPVAWCAFGDRSDFPRMQRSALLRPVDDEPVVSLACLLIKKDHRGDGLSAAWISAVCDYLAETSRTRTVEAYPVEPPDGRTAGPDTAMTGIASAFTDAGFTEITRARSARHALRTAMTTATDWVEDHFIAGHVALDLANTVYRRWPELGADLFTNAEALSTWLDRAHLLPAAGATSRVTDLALEEARALRGLLWEIFDAQKDGHTIPADPFAGLLDTARRGIAHVTVSPDGSMTSQDAAGALAIVALRATTLVLDPPPQGVRACDRCGWFFIDTSRGRRRRWCSMKTCGNQTKAARHRSTHP